MLRSSTLTLLFLLALALAVLIAAQGAQASSTAFPGLVPTNIHGIYRVQGVEGPLLAYPLGTGGLAYATKEHLYIVGRWVGEYGFRGLPTVMKGYGGIIVFGTSLGDLYVYNGSSLTLTFVSTLRDSVSDAYIDQMRSIIVTLDSRGIIYIYKLGTEGRFEAGSPGQEGTSRLAELLAQNPDLRSSVLQNLGAELVAVEQLSFSQIRAPLEYSALTARGEDSTRLVALIDASIKVSTNGKSSVVDTPILAVFNASKAPFPPDVLTAAALPGFVTLLDSAVVGNKLYTVLAGKGMLYIYMGSQLAWKYYLGEEPINAVIFPTPYGVRLHVSTSKGNLYVFTVAGQEAALLRVIPVTEGPLRLARLPGLVLGYDRQNLYCFDPQGEGVWNGFRGVPLGSIVGASTDPVEGALTVYGSSLYYSSSPRPELARLEVEIHVPSGVPLLGATLRMAGGESVAEGFSTFYVQPGLHYIVSIDSPVLGEISSEPFLMPSTGMKLVLEPPVVEPSILVLSSGDPLNITEGPVEGARVTMTLQTAPGISYTGYTDKNGLVHLEAPGYGETRFIRGGTYKIVVEAEGFRTMTKYVTLMPVGNNTAIRLELKLSPIIDFVHIVLKDAVRGINVQDSLTMTIRWPSGEVELEVNSTVSLALPPGTYSVTIRSEYYEPLTATVSVPGDVTLTMKPITTPVRILVTDTLGRNVPNAALTFLDPHGYTVEAISDEKGGATVELPLPGPYRVRADAEGYLEAEAELDPRVTRELVLVLRPVTFNVAVVPSDPYTGEMVPAKITITSKFLSLEAVPGESVSLPMGTYTVIITANGYKEFRGTLNVNMSGEYRFALERAEYRLDLIIVGYRDKPVKAKVMLEPQEPIEPVEPLEVKGELTVVLTRTTYKLRVEAKGYEPLERTVVLTSDLRLTLKLKPTLTTILLGNLTYIVILAILVGIGYGAYRMYRVYVEKRGRRAEKEEEELELPEFGF